MSDVSVPRLVVFDHSVAKNSPAGSCVLAQLDGLAASIPVTVFSDCCDLTDRADVEWRRVPLPAKPIFLRYWVFQFIAPFRFVLWRLKNLRTPIRIQTTQGQFIWSDVSYAHFCHRAYLRNAWTQSSVTGLRRVARKLNHLFNSATEGLAFRCARKIVVPSEGLARELGETYPDCGHKLEVLANPVDLDRFARPDAPSTASLRTQYGIGDDEIVCTFMALGDFARKGLGLIIEALSTMEENQRSRIRVLVVGGNEGEIREFANLASRNGVESRLNFVGLQKDVRPFLWDSDVFVFPSAYEIFSLAILQAAAAGLPALVPRGLYGAEEFIVDGENGWLVERSVDGVAAGLARILSDHAQLARMSTNARTAVGRYSKNDFVSRWQRVYEGLQ